MELIDHDETDPCGRCWRGFPSICECGGRLHAEFGDYSREDSYYLEYACERNCDTPYPKEKE
jgi:hypothetical protein